MANCSQIEPQNLVSSEAVLFFKKGWRNLIFIRKEGIILRPGGCSSTVEHQLPKLGVAGSIPVTRSMLKGAFYLLF